MRLAGSDGRGSAAQMLCVNGQRRPSRARSPGHMDSVSHSTKNGPGPEPRTEIPGPHPRCRARWQGARAGHGTARCPLRGPLIPALPDGRWGVVEAPPCPRIPEDGITQGAHEGHREVAEAVLTNDPLARRCGILVGEGVHRRCLPCVSSLEGSGAARGRHGHPCTRNTMRGWHRRGAIRTGTIVLHLTHVPFWAEFGVGQEVVGLVVVSRTGAGCRP
jgi:hypothetical protein